MDSTSTSGHANSNHYYDVFVNHRGPDVKMTFVSHLYRRLIPYRLRVFLDYEEMQPGENLTPQIKEAIESASVHVAIFSPGYANSKWCLDELIFMLKSGVPIIPVFYGVKPADLRWTNEQTNGVYAQALCDLEQSRCYDSTIIGNWRTALSSVRETTGLDLEAFKGDEGVLLQRVLECVLKTVKKIPLNVAKHPTGLDEKAQDFEEKVLSRQHSGRARFVVIAGMGGVGKTTLAKKLFNQKSLNYSKSYFLFDIRENAIKSSIHSLQRELLNGLTHLNLHIDSIAQGKALLRKHLEKMRVLIVLDDVDNVDQVDSLLPMEDVLQSESLILITSRDKNVLAMAGVQESSVYRLTGLNERHSTELFCSYAFRQPHPPSEFESLVHQFLRACNGLPLALKVFGRLVYGKNKHYGEKQFEKNEKTLHKDIKESLKISYDALDEEEKYVFLDIACFFRGENKDMAMRIWEASDLSSLLGFQTLQENCLVEVDIQNKIRMHDLLRVLGRFLARDPSLPCRLWRGKKDIDDLRQHSSVRGIRWTNQFNEEDGDEDDDSEEEDGDEDDDSEEEDEEEDGDEDDDSEEEDGDEDDDAESSYLTRKWSQLTEEVKVTKLQLLDVNILSKNFIRGLDSPNLLWLRWWSCRLSSLPAWIPMRNLRVLEVYGRDLETLWKGKSKVPSQLRELRELRIFAPLSKIPESIGMLKHLERIEIRHSNFKDLPTKFGRLRSLEELHIFECVKLKSIRGSAELIKLRIVVVYDCPELEELPDFENLRSLEEFHISECLKLKSIAWLAELTNLRIVNVRDCPALEELPGFENLRSLEEFHICECVMLKSIAWSAQLTKLRIVDVHHCPELEELTGFENLRSLEEFHISECLKLKSIRGSAELIKLRIVVVYDCPELAELPDFENLRRSLEEFHISECVMLRRSLQSFE